MGKPYTPDAWVSQDLRAEAETLADDLLGGLREAIGNADHRIAMPGDPDAALAALAEPLPEHGEGCRKTLAAHGADLLATAFDAITYSRVVSPVGVRMELQALNWLKELLNLPASMGGVMVTGATMANFVGLAAARQWWGEQLGFDVSETGLAGQPQLPVLTSGYLHASSRKVLGLLGIGRACIQEYRADPTGRIDLEGFAQGLRALDGRPAVVVVNAGEVNTGDFDPVRKMIDQARQHNCWVHVDGAFGLLAAVSPRTAHLVQGAGEADSITVDGHKWLNVPYDSGYSFVRDHRLMADVVCGLGRKLETNGHG